jgi:hypothetical protein
MKATALVTVLCLAVTACHSPSVPAERIVVTTPIGRKERVTRQYDLKEIEAGAAAPQHGTSPFDIQHPVFPEKPALDELRTQFKAGDQLWYFQGLDSGWAIVRHGQVAWVLVTNHEY